MKIKLMAILMLATLTVNAQHEHHKSDEKEKVAVATPVFGDKKVSTAYAHYLTLKDALVASKTEDAKKAATELKASLKSLSDSKDATTATDKVLAAANLKGQREAFSTLSDAMAKIVKANKLSAGALYLEYCPMANDGQGAFWLSNEKEIKNPYFGDMMLKCGSVKETIQ